MTTIFLAGASRGVGREVARCLLAQKLKVIALLRSHATHAELEAMGVQVLMGDALDPVAVEQAMAQEPIDAVISTIGGKPTDGERSDFLGNKNLIDAAVKARAKKFVLVTSIGSGNSAPALPPKAMEALAAVLAEKEQAENHLMASGLTYTIIRPGGLTSDPPTDEGILTENPLVAGTIHRADVAELVCRCLMSDRANQKILSAVDRNLIYGQPEFQEFIP
ncbi:SDR family oxidoreductase [Leptodesmis sichuanensis]|uniref:SDR family oxidoreductase n=1 Tax=Leptodesmis sichuanensis TaxID=2906798 RepID=UPI001F240349|nr:SDR family oxidoreductase [Leptodesmis sichuanensis]UIE39336.1 SDR family oxidoreductase [Leptodesmis sichuanensis A121]